MAQSARIVYIEPNDIASVKGINGGRIDNVTWNPEDLNMSVDLQVVVPDVNDCGLVDYSDKAFNMSLFEGKKLNGKNYLTTDYVNIGFQEFRKNGVSDRETLGVNSIDINFDEYFFPEVSVKMTDVRGNSLLSPTEYGYYEDLREEATGEKNNFKNLYKCLFHFPYPKFFLTVKGFYGTNVTFELAQSDFKTTFNSDTGNFDVELNFKGYLYGLYTDIPINYILIAPYIDSPQNTGDPGSYWSGQESFTYDNGTRIFTFVEFLEKFVRLAETVAKDNATLENNDGINEYVKSKETVEKLKKLLDAYMGYIDSFNVKQGISVSKGENHNAYFANIDKETLVKNVDFSNLKKVVHDILNSDHLQASEDKRTQLTNLLTDINKDIDDKFEFPCAYPFKNKNNIPSQLVFYSMKDCATWLKECDGDSTLSNDITSKGYAKKYNSVAIIKTYGVPQRLEELIKSSTRETMNSASVATDELNDIIVKYLGFKPTIRNVFRMLFAHIQTFMHFLYEDTLSTISTQINSGDRIKVSDVGGKVRLDIPKKRQTDQSSKLPPFVGMYEENNGKWEMKYPYEFTMMPEVKLVNNMTNAAMCFRKKINDILDYIDKSGIADGNIENGYKMKFLPLLLSDINYKGQNPYSYLKYKGTADNDCVGEIAYQVLLRTYAAYITRDEKRTEVRKNWIERIMRIEACNYYLANPKITNSSLKTLFKSLSKNENQITESLNSFINGHKANLTGVKLFDQTNKCMVYDAKNIEFPMFSNGVLSGDNNAVIYKGKDSEGDGLFKVYREKERATINSFKDYAEPLSKIKEGVLDENDADFITSLFVLNVDEDYFQERYNQIVEKKNNNQKYLEDKNYRIYTNKGKSIYKIGAYDSGNNENKDYKTLLKELFDSKDYANHRIPGLSMNDKINAFTSDGYAVKFKSRDNYVKGAVILSLMYNVNVSVVNHLKVLPLFEFLYLGAALYLKDNNITDVDINNHSEEPPLADTTLGTFKEVLNRYKKRFIDEFKKWADNDGKVMWDLLVQSTYVDKDGFKVLESNSTTENSLLKFVMEQCYVYGPLQDGYSNPQTIQSGSGGVQKNTYNPKIEFSLLTTFFDTLCKLYEIDSDEESTTTTENEQQTMTDADVSKNTKLSIYRTLKNLNDKWLSSYTFERFKLSRPSDEQVNKVTRYGNGGSITSKSEWDSFLYVDAFYNDIGDEFMISPKIIYNMIRSVADANEDYNLYQFMADLLQKSKMMLIPLPVYNNYYDSTTISRIFTPHPVYTNEQSLGNTFLCMYTYEPSRVVEDKKGGYDSDGLQIADGVTGEISSISNPDALQLFHSGNNLDINVPAFGVTFARQNQSYFKDISISMDTPQTTDYGIMNTFELARLGGNGFSSEPFAVGQDIFSIYSNRSYTCEVTMMGCANILPMMYFQLNNVPMFKGAYMITKVSHSIVPGDFVTKFTGVRVSKNQLPFNKDVFNMNTFMAMVNDFIARGGSYDPSVNAASAQLISAGGATGTIEKFDGDVPISVNGLCLIMAFEDWTDKSSKTGYGTIGADATAKIQKYESVATVGPGLTTSVDSRIQDGVRFTGEEIVSILLKTLSAYVKMYFDPFLKNWRNLPQTAIDALFCITHNGGKYYTTVLGLKRGNPQELTVQQLADAAIKDGERIRAKGRNSGQAIYERRVAEAHVMLGKKEITGVNASNKAKFNQYWNPSGKGYEVAKKILQK